MQQYFAESTIALCVHFSFVIASPPTRGRVLLNAPRLDVWGGIPFILITLPHFFPLFLGALACINKTFSAYVGCQKLFLPEIFGDNRQ